MPIEVRITGHQTKEALKSSTCVLPISVGQDYHMGPVFAETLRQIHETFAHVIIVVADTLQTNSLILKGTPTSEARQLALNNGTKWLSENNDAISTLPEGFCTIMRWDEWLEKPGYAIKKAQVDEKYISEALFTASVNTAAREYRKLHHAKAKAAKQRGLDSDALCREVILEEGAVIGLWIESGFHYMAYPIEHSPASKQIFDCLKSMYEANLELLNIEIENKPVATPSAAASQLELSEEQRSLIHEFEEMITQPFLTQLFAVSRGHLIDSDALKIALLLSIEEKVKIACTGLREKMTTRQLANNGLAEKKQSIPKTTSHEAKAATVDTQATSSLNYASMFAPIQENRQPTSLPSSPTKDTITPPAQRRHSHPGVVSSALFPPFPVMNDSPNSSMTSDGTTSSENSQARKFNDLGLSIF